MAISGQMSDPSQLAGMFPMGNISGAGSNTLGPLMTQGGSLGGVTNPFIGTPSSGSSMPAYNSPYGGSPWGATGSGVAGLPGSTQNPNNPFGYLGSSGDIAKSFQKAGYPSGVGTALAAFLQSGAGFNPQVAQWMIQAMQPQIAQGQANLMEQFGGTGTAGSSGAQLGLAGYEAQTNAAIGQIFANMYQQSTQNYMNTLLQGSYAKGGGQQGGGALGGIANFLGGAMPGIGSALESATGGALPGWATILMGL